MTEKITASTTVKGEGRAVQCEVVQGVSYGDHIAMDVECCCIGSEAFPKLCGARVLTIGCGVYMLSQ